MGNPDLPAPAHVIEKLKETLGKPRTDRYSASRGIPGLRRAQAAYYERRFGVKLNPDTQVVATLGSKEGFANVAQAITAPGDVVLVPEPELSDPRLRLPDGGRRDPLGAVGADAGFLPRRSSAPSSTRSRSRSRSWSAIRRTRPPMSPTSTSTRSSSPFAKKHGIFVLSDLAYAEVYFDDKPPPSILQVPGAKDIAVEFTSMSKTYSMPGWRIGFAVGNERMIAALGAGQVLSRLRRLHADPGGGGRGAQRPEDCIREMRAIYKRRRDVLVESFGRAGWEIPPPRASMFAWAPIPEPFRTLGSVEFAKLLVEKADVAVAPGIGFGEHGEGYVRIALVENEQRIRQAARNIRRFLETGPEKLHNVVPLAKRR